MILQIVNCWVTHKHVSACFFPFCLFVRSTIFSYTILKTWLLMVFKHLCDLNPSLLHFLLSVNVQQGQGVQSGHGKAQPQTDGGGCRVHGHR